MAAWSAPNNDHSSHTYLPSGNCNFADLSRSNEAPKCGCRRFWSDPSKQNTSQGQSDGAWCFCGHHACFHDQYQPADTLRQESRPPISARGQFDASESVADVASQRQSSQEDTVPWIRPSPPRNVGLGLRDTSAPAGIWDALNSFQRRHAGNGSDRSSILPSTATPSVPTSQAYSSSAAFMRQVMNLSNTRRSGRIGPADPINDAGSATEINTPSIDGTPLLTRPSPHVSLPNDSPMGPPSVGQPHITYSQPRSVRHESASIPSPTRKPASQQSSQIDNHHASRSLVKDASLNELQNLVKGCTRRLDLLESLSYTHVPLEEVEEKFEQVEGRLIGLEDFRDHLQSRWPAEDDDDDRRSRKRRLLPAEATTSFNSDDSLSQDSARSSSSAVSATAAVYAEYNGRFETLQQRVEALESALPTPSSPWRVEVVLLPWGRHMPGIWHSAASMSDEADRRDSREEWSGAHSTAHGIFGESSSHPSGWSSDSIQAWADSAKDWLSPKACGPNGLVYQRLWSRGLVQNIDIESTDAFTFMQRCKAAFRHVLHQANSTPPVSSARLEYDALREPLVPLRKVKKVSRLRFLAPSEMISSALWTPSFLESSVFMIAKGHQRRLYLTFPEAYIQQTNEGWTWQTVKALRPIRQLSLRTGPGFDGLPQKADSEACWAHHATLDAPPFADSSFTSNASRQSIWSTKSNASRQTVRQEEFHPPSAMVSPISEARTLRDSRRRTVSIPPSEGEPSSSANRSKRRVASFETSALDSKRRRTSASSSQHPRPGPAYTPRLSREPPSPFASEHPTDRGGSESTSARRVVTPLAYETPHSHTNNTVATLHRENDGDTEADTDIAGREIWSGRGEDEWHGVAADEHFMPPLTSSSATGRETLGFDAQAGDFERFKAYRQQEDDLDDEVDVGGAEEVLESLAQHMRMSYTRCRRHGEKECPRCPEVEHRYSLRSARGAGGY
ncbi:hypothetical protein C1H76_6097 [Elsinoe australis]|uniref:Uncharacterized protein n=1 Tax=Elsinoe australis TaxID=40998 RepID=A0A4U7AXM2_9PEZI|nr:hypothetical protein C1H76_6097 [Elsinoe australis]